LIAAKENMEHTADILLDLFVIFALAKIAGEAFRRAGQPSVVGELLVGVAIGPHALGIVDVSFGDEEGLSLAYEVLAELGLIVLLFMVGLETALDELISAGRRSIVVAVLGVALPFALGTGFMAATGSDSAESLFVGAALSATSVGITARVLRELGILRSTEANIIIGAAVIDDVLALLVLAVVSQIGDGESVNVLELGTTAMIAVSFLAFALLLGSRAARRYSLQLQRLGAGAPLVLALGLMLGMSAVAAELGLAGIIGAFVAGLMLGESREHLRLEHSVQPIYEFLTPFFFVITGAQVDLGAMFEGDVLALCLAITALAIAGKVIACGGATYGLGWRSMGVVGTGMVPRGEIGLVVASIGLAQGSTANDVFTAVVFMSIATALVVPPVLRVLVGRRGDPEPSPAPEATVV
jgi:Kef-type K+ transport system membrane component KefB